jgi:orotate phosphoribosyltransferase
VDHSAVQYVQRELGMQVCTIARLADLLHYLTARSGGEFDSHRERVLAYRQRYGVS